MNTSAATQAAPKGQGQSPSRTRAPEVGLRVPAPQARLGIVEPKARLDMVEPKARLDLVEPQARLHSVAPQAHPHPPAPEPGSWLHAFLAFLLQLAGLLPNPATPEACQVAQALQDFQDLLARYQAGQLALPRRPHHRAPQPRPRLPRARRRILLTPGLHAALFFTPRAAIAARARIAARADRLTTALRARSQTPVSIFGLPATVPNHTLFVPLS